MQALRLLGSSLTEKKAEKEVERMIKEEHDRLDEASKVLWRAGYHNWASSSSREARFRQDRVLINLVHMCGATIQVCAPPPSFSVQRSYFLGSSSRRANCLWCESPWYGMGSSVPVLTSCAGGRKVRVADVDGGARDSQGHVQRCANRAPEVPQRPCATHSENAGRNALIAKNLREQEEREFEEEYLKRRRREVTRQDYIAGFRKSLDFWGAAEGGRPELAQMQEGGGGGEKLSERTKRLAEIQASIITMENSMRIAREKLLEDLGVEEELRAAGTLGCGGWRSCVLVGSMQSTREREREVENIFVHCCSDAPAVEQCSCASRRTMMMCLCHRSDENNKLWLLPDGSFVLINEHASCLRTFGSGKEERREGNGLLWERESNRRKKERRGREGEREEGRSDLVGGREERSCVPHRFLLIQGGRSSNLGGKI
eukprot:757656-Hanusia_phi.AAC.6